MTPDLFSIPGHWAGRLAIVTRPRGGDWLEDETAGWQQVGLDVIVSLLEADLQNSSVGFVNCLSSNWFQLLENRTLE